VNARTSFGKSGDGTGASERSLAVLTDKQWTRRGGDGWKAAWDLAVFGTETGER
jgi:hypothetical protein